MKEGRKEKLRGKKRAIMKFPREVTGFEVTKMYYQKLEPVEGGGGGGGGGGGRGRGRLSGDAVLSRKHWGVE